MQTMDREQRNFVRYRTIFADLTAALSIVCGGSLLIALSTLL